MDDILQFKVSDCSISKTGREHCCCNKVERLAAHDWALDICEHEIYFHHVKKTNKKKDIYVLKIFVICDIRTV